MRFVDKEVGLSSGGLAGDLVDDTAGDRGGIRLVNLIKAVANAGDVAAAEDEVIGGRKGVFLATLAVTRRDRGVQTAR